MKKIWIFVALLLLAALMLSGCYIAFPSDSRPVLGSIVYFGAYNNDAIPWEVLDNDGSNVLLVSEHILDTRAYHSADEATWSESDLRAWLNGDFYDAAFTNLEKSALLGSDKVALLTLAQAQDTDYFDSDSARIASFSGTNSIYWLTGESGAAKCVTDTGTIESADATNTYGVRPVINISISAIAQLIEYNLSGMAEGEVDDISTLNNDDAKLALWDETLPSLSVSGYAVSDDGTLTIDCTASSALVAGEKVYAYFDGTGSYAYDYLGCSSLSGGKLTYNHFASVGTNETFNVQLAVVKPSSTDSHTWAVGPASTEFGPVHLLNIYGIEEGGSYPTGQSLDFTAVGLYADPVNNPENYYERYRPASWSVGSQSGTFVDLPYTDSTIFSAPGDYTLTVVYNYEYYANNSWKTSGSISRTVSFHVAEPVSLTPSPADGIICVGESITLTPSIEGGTWDFDSNYLSQVGNVFTGLKEGTTTVKYTADGLYDTCTVTIVKVDVAGVTLSSASETLKKGETTTLTATLLPSDISYSDVTWKSSDESIATVDASGKVTAKSFGSAAITAEAEGEFAICIINVVKTDVAGVTLSSASETLKKDETVTLGATVSPSNATYTDVTWKSSDTDVVTVNANGKVTVKDYGVATITAEADGITAVCTITVVKTSVTGVSLSRTYKKMDVGDNITIKATISPGDATNPDVKWKSTNTSVATVSVSGKVTAVSDGAAAIIADADGAYAVCTILVRSEQGTDDGNDNGDNGDDADNDDNAQASPTPAYSGDKEDVPDTGDDSPQPTTTPETVIITIIVSDLPEGTAAVKLPDGSVVELGGGNTLEVEVGSEYLNDDGSVELIALDNEGVPLGLYDADNIATQDTGSAGGVWPVLMWVLIGIAGVGAVGAALFLIMKKRNRARVQDL